MEEIILREASLNDYNALLRFEQGVINAERPFDPTLKEGTIHYYDIREMINATHIHLVVAEREGELVGCGYARIDNAKPYLRHVRYAYLGFMYTDPKYRGQGINKKIVDALKKWTASKGVFELRLEVYFENHAAQKAYARAGFVNHMIEMRMGLEESQGETE